jgi:hypothetical protein
VQNEQYKEPPDSKKVGTFLSSWTIEGFGTRVQLHVLIAFFGLLECLTLDTVQKHDNFER